MIPMMLKTRRISMKGKPRFAASKVSKGIFVVDHAPIKMKTFRRLLPFFSITPAMGNATYNGPAAAEPSRNAIKTPLVPDTFVP
jgi:hypothetical protein